MLGLSKGKHTKKLFIGTIVSFGLFFSFLTASATVFAAPSSDNANPSQNTTGSNATPSGNTADNTNSDEDATTCAIEKMGWILCPVIETSGKIADSAFEQLSKHFLETEPELVASVRPGGDKPGTYIAWELARNIANIMFIIAFLIIIFSQVTGRGIDNYGIKKLLPKLIIAAIAVNVSYYICQAMVDLTNILGYSIENFMIDVAHNVSDKAALPVAAANHSASQTSALVGHGTLATIALGALGLAAAVFVILPLMGSGILAILIVCLVIIIILLMRKAFIVLLVVVSPIAFVFYLLPNTEKLFQKWLKMFWQLLMVFPIVGILFGGGQLASAIILISGTQLGSGTDSTIYNYSDDKKSERCIQLPSPDPHATGEVAAAKLGTCGARSTPLMLGLVAAGVAVAPLFAVWAVLKGALSAAGAIGGKISGAVQGAGSKASNKANGLERRMWGAGIGAAKAGIATNALNGGFGRRTAGMVRRRQLSKKRRDEQLKAAQEGFDATEGADISKDILAARQAGNAAQKGLRDKFIQEQLNTPGLIGNNLGDAKGDDAIKNALIIQQTQARSEAQRDIEARLDPADLTQMGDQLRDAFIAADQVEVRAIASQLLKAGAGGQYEIREAVKHAVNSGHDTPDMANALRQEMQGNHPGYKDKDWALGNWAEGKSSSTGLNGILQNDQDPAIFGGMTPAQFASQSKARQVAAAKVMSSDAQGVKQLASIRDALAKSPTQASNLDNSIRSQWGI